MTSRNNRAFLRAARKIGCLGVPALLAALAWQVWTGRGSLFGEWAAFELGILLAGGATFLLLFFLMDTTTPGARLLSMPWLQYLGVVSYEWFLLHQPVIRACRKQANGAHGSLLVYFVIVVLPMVATLVAAVLINRFISLPIIEWGRARFSRTHPPRALSSSIPPNTSN